MRVVKSDNHVNDYIVDRDLGLPHGVTGTFLSSIMDGPASLLPRPQEEEDRAIIGTATS